MKTILIFSLRLARFLEEQGFYMVDRRADILRPDRTIFLYEDTPQLRAAMTEYTQKYSRRHQG